MRQQATDEETNNSAIDRFVEFALPRIEEKRIQSILADFADFDSFLPFNFSDELERRRVALRHHLLVILYESEGNVDRFIGRCDDLLREGQYHDLVEVEGGKVDKLREAVKKLGFKFPAPEETQSIYNFADPFAPGCILFKDDLKKAISSGLLSLDQAIMEVWKRVGILLGITCLFYRELFKQYGLSNFFDELVRRRRRLETFLRDIEFIQTLFENKTEYQRICKNLCSRRLTFGGLETKYLEELLIEGFQSHGIAAIANKVVLNKKRQERERMQEEYVQINRQREETKKRLGNLQNEHDEIQANRNYLRDHEPERRDDIDKLEVKLEGLELKIEENRRRNKRIETERSIIQEQIEKLDKDITEINDRFVDSLFRTLTDLFRHLEEVHVLPRTMIVTMRATDSNGRTYYGYLNETQIEGKRGWFSSTLEIPKTLFNIPLYYVDWTAIGNMFSASQDYHNPKLVKRESIIRELQRLTDSYLNLPSGFNIEELKEIAFQLGIDDRFLPTEEIAFTQELVRQAELMGKSAKLLTILQTLRPEYEWPKDI